MYMQSLSDLKSMPEYKRLIASVYDHFVSDGIVFNEPSMAQQHFKAECDINNIMRRYMSTGVLVDPLNPGTRRPMFGDFTSLPDYLQAQTIIADANQAFDSLPADLRYRFDNDPAKLLAFLDDSDNYNEAVKLGLVPPVPPSAPKLSDNSPELDPSPSSKAAL